MSTPAFARQPQITWGTFASAALLPNGSANPLAAPDFVLAAGHVASVVGVGVYYCADPGTVAGGDAAWLASATVGGGATLTEVEIDFGSKPAWSATFTVTDAGVSPSSHILPVPSGAVATGRVGNDAEWDSLILSASPGTGSFILTAMAVPGPVVGKRKILYQVTA